MLIEERFWEKVNKEGPISTVRPDLGQCWLWIAGLRGKPSTQYGRFTVYTKHETQSHRFAYELEFGKIPEGKQIDHLCGVHSCVRPNHLEVVDGRTNLLRGNTASGINSRRTHCKHGHEFTPENTFVYRGMRDCRACNRLRKQKKK